MKYLKIVLGVVVIALATPRDAHTDDKVEIGGVGRPRQPRGRCRRTQREVPTVQVIDLAQGVTPTDRHGG